MTTQMHIASQYLAAAGISFLNKTNDDSHTNLGFSSVTAKMYTRPLNQKGDTLSLNYHDFSLEWKSNATTNTLQLNNTTHKDVLKWISEMATKASIEKPYHYEFHYELPYPTITDTYKFTLQDKTALQELINHRKLAQHTLETFLKNHHLNSEIRVWPHHFDIGAFSTFNDEKGTSVGLGLAIPDTMVNDYYFYISAYKGHDAIDTSEFSSLTHGKWYSEEYKGAILPITGVDLNKASAFFEEAFISYKK